MGRQRRQIISREVYEICMRTKKGLPFVCTLYMKLILEGIVARVQRDHKVEVCHIIWMGNHCHILIVAKDSLQCTRFYGEIKKQLTDSIKRLLGVKHLSLWQKNGTSVVRYGDRGGVIHRIAYLYANPARANLVDSIEHYPGMNSFEEFLKARPSVNEQIERKVPWARAPMIQKLPRRDLTEHQDRFFTENLKERAKKRKYTLVYRPNIWMQAFRVEDEKEVAEINAQIIHELREFEEKARLERSKAQRKVMGKARLKREALSLKYISEGSTVKISVWAKDTETRIQMIEEYQEFCEKCTDCYERWKFGDYACEWPPGAFIPPMPPRINWFDDDEVWGW